MNSFTFSFKTEIKVLILVLMTLATFEWYSRTYFVRNVYYSSIPGFLENVRSQMDKSQRSPKVLFVGNSLISCGLDLQVAYNEFSSNHMKSPYMDCAYIMSSHISEWFYMIKNFFPYRPNNPYSVIVWFSTNHLADTIPPRIEVLSYICKMRDLPHLLLSQTHNFEERADLVLSFASKAYLHKNDIRHSILSTLIRNYKSNMDRLYGTSILPKSGSKSIDVKSSYVQLERLLGLLKEMNVHALFVAIPLKDWKYPVDPELIGKIQSAGYDFLDLREVPGLSGDCYLDGLHLNKKGAVYFTRYFTTKILKQYPEVFKIAGDFIASSGTHWDVSNCLSDSNFQELKSKWQLVAGGASLITTVQDSLPDSRNVKALQIETDSDAQILSEKIKIEKGKAYRFTVWVKRESIPIGSAWFGPQVHDLDGAPLPVFTKKKVQEKNPYFWYGRLPDSEWHHVTSYILPSQIKDTWNKIPEANGTVFRLPEQATYISMRLLSCYNNGKMVKTWFAEPCIEAISPETVF